MLVCFTNLSRMEFRVRYLALFRLFSVMDGFEWFWKRSFHKYIQLMLKHLKAPFLVQHLSYYIIDINDLPDNAICNIAIYADDTNQAIWFVATTRIGFWTWIWSTRHCGLWPVDFNAGKTQLVLFDPSINTGDIDVKMDGSVSLLNWMGGLACNNVMR